MDTKNTAAAPFCFSGSVPPHYDKYQGPVYFEPYALEIAKRINPSSICFTLEIASGTGRVTRHLREAIPATAKLVASDISPDMLAVAREKLGSLNIDWQIIDAMEIPFDDNSIDLIVCCFGYMFVPDKSKAFAEAYRVLRPGGTLLFTTWDELELNGASFVHRKTAKEYLKELMPETYKLAFSMTDDKEIRESLQLAGFFTITVERVDKLAVSPTAKEAAYGLVQGGAIYNEIMKHNPAWIEEIRVIVEKELSERFGAEPMIAPMRALITEARK